MQTLIIGAGIAGLTVAWRLAQANEKVTVLEAQAQVGGNVQSVFRDDFLVEKGPNTLLVSHQQVENLLKDLALTPIAANPAANRRFVYRNKKLMLVPMQPLALLTSPLLSAAAKLSLIKLLQKQTPPPQEESLADFVQRRTHREIVDYLLNPFISGIYAGDPTQLSYPAVLPKIATAERKNGFLRPEKNPNKIKSYTVSFAEGLQALPKALAAGIQRQHGQIFLEQQVEKIEKNQESWQVSTQDNHYQAERLIIATPAYVTAALLSSFLPEAEKLKTIAYPSVLSVAMAFDRAAVGHPLHGFGFLIPRKEGIETLGVLFSSTLFPGRAPADKVLLTAFIGGASNPVSPAAAERIFAEIAPILAITAPPLWQEASYWPQAIPQYHFGHLELIQAVQQAVSKFNDLFLLGNWQGGISLGDGLVNALNLAEQLLAKSR
jgi:oxygen-dependent protoporphyrinogen oxidase